MSKRQYGHELSAAVEGANLKVRKLSFAAARAPTLRLGRTRITTIRKTLDEAAARVDALRPPDDAKAANERIAAGLRELAAKAETLSASADSHTLRPLSGFDDQLSQSAGAAKVRNGLRDLTAHGYSIGPS